MKQKSRAAHLGRSTGAEHRDHSNQTVSKDLETSFETRAAELRKLTRKRKQTLSEVLLREGRAER